MIERSEAGRLAALARLEILDTPPESELDDLAELAALSFGAPVAWISLIDADRQWIKARVGPEITQIARDIAFCDHVIRSDTVMVAADARADERFADNPLVVGDPGIGFYAGAPLTAPDGYRVGTLCVIDFKPRADFGEAHQQRLARMASSVSHILAQRAAALTAGRLALKAAKEQDVFAIAERSARVGTWVFELATRQMTWSAETYRLYGFDPDKPAPAFAEVLACYGAEDAARLRQGVDAALREAGSYEHDAPITRPDGSTCYVALRCLPRCDESGALIALVGTVQDVTELKLADAALRASEARRRSLDWALTAYGRSISALLHKTQSDAVMSDVCEAIVEGDAYVLAAVALADPPPSRTLTVAAAAGRGTGYAEGLSLSWDPDSVSGSGPTGHAIRARRPQIMRDSLADPLYEPWREKGLAHGIRSSVTVPFFRGDTPLGVLLVYASQPNAFGDQEMELFQRLGEKLALSITLQEDRARLVASRAAQRQAEEAESAALERLKTSEEHFRLLAENSLDIIIRYDIHGVIQYASPSVKVLGYEPEEVIGLPVDSFRPPNTDGPLLATSLISLREGAPLPRGRLNEYPVTRKDGGLLWMQSNPSPIHDGAGRVIGATTVMRDITERREMEDELRRKHQEAEAAAVVKAQFLANMSHEIRTPLTSVLGFAKLLEGLDGLPETARGYVDRIVAGGQGLLSIVNEILDFSRLEAGRLELDPQPIDLTPFLEETLGLVAAEARAKGLALSLEQNADVPPAVLADSGRLRQVMLNLLGNAIKFTRSGKIEVKVDYAHDVKSLRVAVADTGVGISPEDRGRLFQRFSQVDGSNTREHGGAGLGLAISKGLVEMMDGQIGVESEAGQGATFWFTIAAPVVEPEPETAVAEGEDWAGAPLKLLVVDDVAVNRELITAMLAPFDLHLSEAVSGAEAVEAAMRSQYDLILMDVQMPGMDGLAATRAIRANSDQNRATPILAVSANVLPAQVEACRQAGMNDHIGKPIDPRDLLNKIAVWTQQSQG